MNGRSLTFDFAAVGPDYFRSMGIPLKGRDFSYRDDQSAPAVAIVNEAFASKAWPGEDPIGKAMPVPGAKAKGQIIGVVRTGKYRHLGEDPRPFVFWSLLQNYESRTTVVIRTSAPPAAMVETVRRTMATLDPALAVQAQTLREHLKLALFPTEAAGAVLGSFGLLALALAVVGLYGTLAYAVSQRTREIGIRRALGARSSDVLMLVTLQGIEAGRYRHGDWAHRGVALHPIAGVLALWRKPYGSAHVCRGNGGVSSDCSAGQLHPGLPRQQSGSDGCTQIRIELS